MRAEQEKKTYHSRGSKPSSVNSSTLKSLAVVSGVTAILTLHLGGQMRHGAMKMRADVEGRKMDWKVTLVKEDVEEEEDEADTALNDV